MQLCESVEINALPGQVFTVLADFASYRLWNPWIVDARGECREGEVITVSVDMGGPLKSVRHRVDRVSAPDFLQWSDLGWFTRLAYGQRTRKLTGRVGR